MGIIPSKAKLVNIIIFLLQIAHLNQEYKKNEKNFNKVLDKQRDYCYTIIRCK